jgi:hypothetical protein
MNYYRKLLEKKTLKDASYEVVDGKLKQTKKGDISGVDPPTMVLGPDWESDHVKQVEKNVDMWLKQHHQRSGR